jgi:hypothetical protein
MLTEDKVRAGVNYDLNDNINTRDMNRTLRNTALLFAGIVTLLVAAGAAHTNIFGQATDSRGYPLIGQRSGTPAEFVEPVPPDDTFFDVHQATGFVARPGTIGQPQTYTRKALGMVEELPDARTEPFDVYSTLEGQRLTGKSKIEQHQM